MRPDAAPIGGDVEVLRRYIGHCTFPERRSTKTTLHLPLNSSPMLSFPITPPADSESDDDRDGESVETDSQAHKILETATHVLATEANALLHLSRLYATDALARDGFLRAVEAIAESQEKDGKTIVIGVGKSGKIGDKLVASMNSLGLLTTFLNPTDALHGDLGIIRKNDVLLLITYSGKTPELLQLLPHLPAHLPLIALTAHTSYQTSPLTRGRSSAILLPAPIPESEVASFGVAAPTTSTTVAMAIGDALSLSVAERIHSGECKGPREVFKKNHPGGAIGVANGVSVGVIVPAASPPKMKDIMIPISDIPCIDIAPSSSSSSFTSSPSRPLSPSIPIISGPESDISESISSSSETSSISETSSVTSACDSAPDTDSTTVLSALRLAVTSPSSWIRTSTGLFIHPKRLLSCNDLTASVTDPTLGLVVRQDSEEVCRVPADEGVEGLKSKLEGLNAEVVMVLDAEVVVGVVEVSSIRGGERGG